MERKGLTKPSLGQLCSVKSEAVLPTATIGGANPHRSKLDKQTTSLVQSGHLPARVQPCDHAWNGTFRNILKANKSASSPNPKPQGSGAAEVDPGRTEGQTLKGPCFSLSKMGLAQ